MKTPGKIQRCAGADDSACSTRVPVDKSRRDISILSWKRHGRAKELATDCPLSLCPFIRHCSFFIRVGFERSRLASNYAPLAGSEVRVCSRAVGIDPVRGVIIFFFFILSARKRVTRNPFSCSVSRFRPCCLPTSCEIFCSARFVRCQSISRAAESRHLKLITSTKFAASALRWITRKSGIV